MAIIKVVKAWVWGPSWKQRLLEDVLGTASHTGHFHCSFLTTKGASALPLPLSYAGPTSLKQGTETALSFS